MIPTEAQIIQGLKETSIYGFIKLNGITTEKSNPLGWKNHKFLFEIYDDWSPIQACCKASQIGFSTMVILKALFAAKYNKWNIIYTLPTGGDVNTFVTSKVNKIIENNDFLISLIKDKDTIFQKQIGNSVIYFKGTTTGKEKGKKTESSTGIMISSDLNIHDESDRSDQVMLEQFESRLDFSDYKGRWYFSNPTTPKTGAHKWFLKSDQKHWFHKCSRCNKYFYLEWNDKCVDRDKELYMCPKCRKPLREEDRRKGEWIKRYRDRNDISGYWINQMMAPWKSCTDLLRKEEDSSKTHFMNFCLGMPYVGSDVVVNRSVIIKNIVLDENKGDNVAMGVDNGIEKHYVIGNKQGIFKIGKTKSWDEIEALIKRYNAITVIDALPYPKRPKELVKKYPRAVYNNYYKRDKDDLKVIRFQKREKAGVVYSDRNKLFDEVIGEFYAGNVNFNIKEHELEDYIEHWENLHQLQETDSMDIMRTVWESGDNPDHYCHATLYWYIAMQRVNMGGGAILGKQVKRDRTDYNPVFKDGKVEVPGTEVEYIFEKPKKSWDEY